MSKIKIIEMKEISIPTVLGLTPNITRKISALRQFNARRLDDSTF
jgi:hypothetical protein